jgi:class 3 adenylate cyclase
LVTEMSDVSALTRRLTGEGASMASGIQYVKNGDVSLAYLVLGDAPIDVLLVSGFVSHLEVAAEEPGNARFLARLLSFARVIAFDKRGMGLSDRNAGIPTIEATVDDMVAVLDAAGSAKPVILGISEGGTASIVFAATHPQRTSALVLWGAYARRAWAPDYTFGFQRENLEERFRFMEKEWGTPVFIELFAPSRSDDEHFRDWWGRMLRSGASPSATRDLLSLYLDLDARHVLPLIQAPTLVLHAKDDRIVEVENGRYIAEHIPGAKLVELPIADHLIAAHPDDAADEIQQFLTGKRPAPEPDRMLATVLFTDIVDSTRRAAELGDRRWRSLLDQHNSVVRSELERFRGRVVNTTGDGFLATFDGPARAVQASRSIRDAMRPLGIEVRAGLHTGECEIIGDDIGGIAVHIAARVAAMAGPGEILTSSTVRDLTVGSGIAFVDRGRHALKGVPGEWQLLAVAG